MVEALLEAHGLALVRCLDARSLVLTKTSSLAGYPIKGLDTPRKLLPSGNPDLELFGLFLAKGEQLSQLAVGREVFVENR